MPQQHKNLVVTDLCLLRQRPEEYVRDDEGFVVPDAMISELVDRADDQLPERFVRWASRRPERLYIGGYWWDIQRRAESSCKKVAPPGSEINWWLTESFRKALTSEPDHWTKQMKLVDHSGYKR